MRERSLGERNHRPVNEAKEGSGIMEPETRVMKQTQSQPKQTQHGGPVPQVPSMKASTTPKKRVRWRIVWGALLVVVVLYVLATVESSVTWNSIMDSLHVRNKERYTALFLLGCAVTACCAIGRILRDRGTR